MLFHLLKSSNIDCSITLGFGYAVSSLVPVESLAAAALSRHTADQSTDLEKMTIWKGEKPQLDSLELWKPFSNSFSAK